MRTLKNDVDAWAAALEQGRAVSFAISRTVAAAGFAATLVPALVGLVVTLSDSILWQIVGWLIILLSLLFVVGQIRALRAQRPVVEVSPEGLSMTSAKAGVIPWSQMIDVHGVEQSENGSIEVSVTEAEAARQAKALSRVTPREVEGGTTEQVLWVPSAVRASKPALGSWLAREVRARRTE